MEAEKYLEAIANCPDDGLTTEYGIYDNFQLRVGASPGEVLKYFEGSSSWNTDDFSKSLEGHFNYNQGTVLAIVHKTQGKRRFSSIVTLHPYQGYSEPYNGKKMKNVSNERAIAIALTEIGNSFMDLNFSFLLPSSKGWAHLGDSSRIVVYRPNLEENVGRRK